MTWSLIAGRHSEPFSYYPGTEANDLQDAMTVLGSFDFIIGVGIQSVTATCNSNILTLMGMRNATLGHEELKLQRERGEGEQNYQHYYRRDKYAQLNDYDVVLFNYSVPLMLADCDFFGRVVGEATEQSGREAFFFDSATTASSVVQSSSSMGANIKSGAVKGALVSGKVGSGHITLKAGT